MEPVEEEAEPSVTDFALETREDLQERLCCGRLTKRPTLSSDHCGFLRTRLEGVVFRRPILSAPSIKRNSAIIRGVYVY